MSTEIEWPTEEEERKLRFMLGDGFIESQKRVWGIMKQNADKVDPEVLREFNASMKRMKSALALVTLDKGL